MKSKSSRLFRDHQVGRLVTRTLAAELRAGHRGADAQGPAGEISTPGHGMTVRGGHRAEVRTAERCDSGLFARSKRVA
jgi:hypothetical protein